VRQHQTSDAQLRIGDSRDSGSTLRVSRNDDRARNGPCE
jgi:hypothetical protein